MYPSIKNQYFRGFRNDLPEEDEVIAEKPMVQVLGASSNKNSYSAPTISTLYCPSGHVSALFQQAGCPRSAVLDMKDLRHYVTKYVNENELRYRTEVRLDNESKILLTALYFYGAR